MNRLLRLRDGSSVNTIGLIAIAALIATAVMAALVISPVVSLYRHPPSASDASRPTAEAINKFHEATARGVEMVDNRSWFYEPKPPVKDQGPVVTPRYYAGPQLLAFINGVAWFADGQKISAVKPKDKSVEFVRSNAPWSITVKWEGAEFDVDLFKRVDLMSVKDGPNVYVPPNSNAFGSPARNLDGSPALSGRPLSDRAGGPPEARFGPGAGLQMVPSAGPGQGEPGGPRPGAEPPVAPPAPDPQHPSSQPPSQPPMQPPADPQPVPGTPGSSPTPSPNPAPAPEPSKEPAPGATGTPSSHH